MAEIGRQHLLIAHGLRQRRIRDNRAIVEHDEAIHHLRERGKNMLHPYDGDAIEIADVAERGTAELRRKGVRRQLKRAV